MSLYNKIFLSIRYALYIILVLVLSSCAKYEVETYPVEDDIYRYNLYSNYQNTTFNLDFNKYTYKDDWELVSGYVALEMDSLAWGETFDTIYLDNNKQAIFINTYLEIDTCYIGMVWEITNGTVTANNVIYNYNFLNYSNVIDVNTTPSKRSYQIVMIDDDTMIILTPRQYLDSNQALQTRECVLEFKRL